MNDSVVCPLCHVELGPCTCVVTNPEDGTGVTCDACLWILDECFKIDITISNMAAALTAEHDVPELLAEEMARSAFSAIIEGDCGRIHHAVLSGNLDLDKDRYTPRIDLTGEWDREPTPADRAAVFAMSLSKAGDDWRSSVPRDCAASPTTDVVWHKRIKIERPEGSPYWRVVSS